MSANMVDQKSTCHTTQNKDVLTSKNKSLSITSIKSCNKKMLKSCLATTYYAVWLPR